MAKARGLDRLRERQEAGNALPRQFVQRDIGPGGADHPRNGATLRQGLAAIAAMTKCIAVSWARAGAALRFGNIIVPRNALARRRPATRRARIGRHDDGGADSGSTGERFKHLREIGSARDGVNMTGAPRSNLSNSARPKRQAMRRTRKGPASISDERFFSTLA